MGNFNKGKKFGGGRDGKKFGGRSSGGDRGGRDFGKGGGGRNFGGDRGGNRGFGGGRSGGRPEMHSATCDDCGNQCEVPFKPSNDKPIYCSNCFKGKDNDNSRDRGGRDFDRRDARPRFDDRNSRPSYNDRKPRQNDAGTKSDTYKEQFEQLNSKLDRLLKILVPSVSEEIQESKALRSRKKQKAEKKQVHTESVKDILAEILEEGAPKKKAVAKKASPKKAAKKTTKKKTVAKKASPKKATKKTTKKKTVAKKVSAKKTTKKTTKKKAVAKKASAKKTTKK